MPVSAEEIFAFLESRPTFKVQRIEVSCNAFRAVRTAVRKIVVHLSQSEDLDCNETCENLRNVLSEWLTVPVGFTQDSSLELKKILGEPADVRDLYGRDIAMLYQDSLTAAAKLPQSGQILRNQVRECLEALAEEGRDFRVYCQRRALEHFETLFAGRTSSPLSGKVIHSIRDYRPLSPFYALVKIGPLRSRGWASMPEALLTAPRFERLVQIVWSGCKDEADFGYDPLGIINSDSGEVGSPAGSGLWPCEITKVEDLETELYEESAEPDELQLFHEMSARIDTRLATMIQIDADACVLLPRKCQVLSYDPGARASGLAKRDVTLALKPGMYFLRPTLYESGFGPNQSGPTTYSSLWKASLATRIKTDLTGLIKQLRVEHLKLLDLASALHHWAKPPTTVIHAPRRRAHFVLLMKALGYLGQPSLTGKESWADAAWQEIGKSRGEAIQAGVVESEELESTLLEELETRLSEIACQAEGRKDFMVRLAGSSGPQGKIYFDLVRAVESPFRAPESRLRRIFELRAVEQWRV